MPNVPSESNGSGSGLTIDRGANGGRISFLTAEELREYLSDEVDAYKWLESNPASGMTQGANIFSLIRNSIVPLIGQLPLAIQNEEDRKQIVDSIEALFQKFSIVSKDGPAGIFVEKLRQKHSDAVALGALAGFMPDYAWPRQETSAVWFGFYLCGQFRENIHNDSIAAQNEYFQRSQSEIHTILDNARSSSTGLVIALKKRLSKSHLRLRAIKRAGVSLGHKWSLQNIASVRSAVDRIDETDRVYKEFMQLKAPVDYWTEKATMHKNKSKPLGWIALGYAAVSVIAISVSGLLLMPELKKLLDVTANSDPTLAFFFGGFALTIITILFWIGRIIVRIYLSEEHLAIDATLRATMVETYLALTNEGKAAVEDRTVILTALFRPTADGIIRDDAAPFMNLASILSKQN